jgi:hypothetical protein
MDTETRLVEEHILTLDGTLDTFQKAMMDTLEVLKPLEKLPESQEEASALFAKVEEYVVEEGKKAILPAISAASRDDLEQFAAACLLGGLAQRSADYAEAILTQVGEASTPETQKTVLINTWTAYRNRALVIKDEWMQELDAKPA